MNPGSIVRCRNREWVLLPSDQPETCLLRPLTGATDEIVAVHRQLTELVSHTLEGERVRSATFPLPSVDDVSDAASAQLLWQAARLTLREGATPFRCLGRISIRPRIYQLVPLLMALRMAPVRLLIADDVGIGKTIEALLIAREMLERGEIKRICILCPPYLCEQWQKELAEKFNLDAVVIRSGTVGQLERRKVGQPSRTVRSIRFFSSDNPVDGVVLDVLLNKATEIHRTLGTHVPVPEESETVTQAVLSALFLRGRTADADQPLLDFGNASPDVTSLHHRWERDAERERVNRTRFAQRALKPADVRQELDRTDAVLGDPAAVREFVLAAAQRIGMDVVPEKRADVFRIPISEAATASVPPAVRFALPSSKAGHWLVTFTSPNDSDTEYLGRNHRFVATLARFLMEEALTKAGKAVAARCGVIRTRAVSRLTTIALLRVRYLVNQPDRAPLLAEEVVVEGFTATAKGVTWLEDGAALALLAQAKPDANVAMTEKRKLTASALETWPSLSAQVQSRIGARASELEQSHKRVRQAVSMKVRDLKVSPQFPPDLLGVLVMQPVV